MLVKHTVIYFLGKLAPAILSLVGVMIYTRLVSPEEYGLFSLITIIVGLINVFCFQWIRSSLIRFYNEKERFKSLMGSIIISHVITLIILGVLTVILVIMFFFNSFNIFYIIIGYIMVVLLSFFELLIVYYRTKLKPLTVTSVNILKSLVVLFTSIILLYLGLDTIGLLLGAIIGSLFGLVLFLRKFYKYNLEDFSLASNKNTQIKLLKYGLPITFSFALSIAMQNIDKIMISSILGLEANGNYTVGYDLIHNLIFMIMTSLSLASFPLILKTIEKYGDELGKKQFKDYIKLLLFISIPACIGLASILNEFTSIIIGDEYSISNNLLILIIMASFFHGLKSYYFDLTLQITGKTLYFFIPALIAIVLNIALNIILLPKYGIEGAAISTVVSFFGSMLISSMFSYKYYKVSLPLKDLTKIAITSLIMFILIKDIYIGNLLISLLVKIISGGIIYTFISFLFNTIGVREGILSKVLKK